MVRAAKSEGEAQLRARGEVEQRRREADRRTTRRLRTVAGQPTDLCPEPAHGHQTQPGQPAGAEEGEGRAAGGTAGAADHAGRAAWPGRGFGRPAAAGDGGVAQTLEVW